MKRQSKNLLKVLAVSALAFSLAGCTPKAETKDAGSASGGGNEGKDLPKIGVIQLMEHTSLNIIYDAFSDELKQLGYIDGENCVINFKNAQGDMANIPTIVQGFKGDKQDVVIAITTPVAQQALDLTKETPVIFSAVTDPVAAGVVSSYDKPDKGMTGTTDAVNVDKIMDLALEITKNVKTVGYIYNPGEENSVSNLASLKKFCEGKNIAIEEASISSSADLQTAAEALTKKVDMIFVANDNTVAEAMPILVQAAIKGKTPLYVGADSMVMDGGFATVGIDYTDLGRETARMADQVLKGKSVEEMPVKVFKDDLFIYINTDTAAALGIEIPEEIRSNEKYVEIKNKKN
ncbi:MAG: ABC transporter substrate-binding protein [Johnsonella sp.]|nr:ABC transporter substrate-binding protein [Johnsonella sp.]